MADSIESIFEAVATAKKTNTKVFDWEKAAKIIRNLNPDVCVSAGIRGNDGTIDSIFENGKPVTDGIAYLESWCGTPVLIIVDDHYDVEIPCYIFKNECEYDWDGQTLWPQMALDILNSDE